MPRKKWVDKFNSPLTCDELLAIYTRVRSREMGLSALWSALTNVKDEALAIHNADEEAKKDWEIAKEERKDIEELLVNRCLRDTPREMARKIREYKLEAGELIEAYRKAYKK